eukprot:4661989-Amphidinium_carterae.1
MFWGLWPGFHARSRGGSESARTLLHGEPEQAKNQSNPHNNFEYFALRVCQRKYEREEFDFPPHDFFDFKDYSCTSPKAQNCNCNV